MVSPRQLINELQGADCQGMSRNLDGSPGAQASRARVISVGALCKPREAHREAERKTLCLRGAVHPRDVSTETLAELRVIVLPAQVTMPDTKFSTVKLDVNRKEMLVQAPKYLLALPLTESVDPDKGTAKWDSDACVLEVWPFPFISKLASVRRQARGELLRGTLAAGYSPDRAARGLYALFDARRPTSQVSARR